MSDLDKDAGKKRPEILAPAGDTNSFLAALAAGADALYGGLKNFSARMEAENFSLTELARLTELAHERGARVYTALNTLIKENELTQAYNMLKRLNEQVHPDGIIVQDLAYLDLVRQTGFTGGLFLSTLAAVTHPEILPLLPGLGVNRVILPRELSLEEIRTMADLCPDDVTLELFVHGALCYCVSGRCYWSSYMGGKSGLRGRCVQPCRRVYTLFQQHSGHRESSHRDSGHKDGAHRGSDRPEASGSERRKKVKGRSAPYFSCQDLSLAAYTAELLTIPHLTSWKIEGRKKGPHYVYHCVRAYRLLRDEGNDAAAREEARSLLDMALGRETTEARFLPKHPRVPTNPSGRTSSGLLVGYLNPTESGAELTSKVELLPDDYVRIGAEGEKWYQTLRISQRLGAGKKTVLALKGKIPPKNTPCYLIDRREKTVVSAIADVRRAFLAVPEKKPAAVTGAYVHPKHVHGKRRPSVRVLAAIPMGRENKARGGMQLGLWLSQKTAAVSKTVARRMSFWIPPVVWPNESRKMGHVIADLWREGCRHFVANAPWQRAFFPEDLPEDADLVAGPFCNLANAASLEQIARLGFTAAYVSPELSSETLLALPRVAPLPLGCVLSGFWPVGISRFGLLGMKQNMPFQSPKGEEFWVREYGQNVWIYPSWPLDLREKEGELSAAGYTFFATLEESVPSTVTEHVRPGLFNWSQALL